METLSSTETFEPTMETITFLGAAGVYEAIQSERPHWDPEGEYNTNNPPIISA